MRAYIHRLEHTDAKRNREACMQRNRDRQMRMHTDVKRRALIQMQRERERRTHRC